MFACIFHTVRRYCYQSGLDQQISTFFGYAAASTIFCEFVQLGYKYQAEDDCSFLLSLASRHLPFLFQCNTFSGKFLWRLNVINVLASLFKDLSVLLATAIGSSVGSLVSSFFDKLSWLVFIPAILLTVFVVIFSTIAIFKYDVTLFGFLSIRPSSIPIQKPPTRHRSPPPAYFQAQDPRPVQVMHEIYQRLAP